MTDRIMCEDRYYKQPALDPKEYKRIIYQPGRVTRIILNRPGYRNATSHAMLAEIDDAFDHASEDPNCHVIVLSGAGVSFCSGDDVIGHTPESAPTLWDGDKRSPEDLIKQYGSETAVWHQYNIEHDHFAIWTGSFFNRLRSVPKPTIAMVHGNCIFMGFLLALAMDITFASEDALFLCNYPAPAIISTLGSRKALELVYEHRFLTSGEALEYHLINRVFPNYEVLERETMAFAYRVAQQSPLALRRAKEAYLDTMDIFGYSTASSVLRTPFYLQWREWAEEGHRMRYEGRGMARTPVALANLKAKLESEGKEVPEPVQKALLRAAERDDRADWQRSLHQAWRSPDRVARAEASAKTYDKMMAEEEKMVKEEMEGRGLSYEALTAAQWSKLQKRLKKP